MRYLHKVNQHEKFVASGIYIHQQDGKATGTIEHWSIHEQPDGAQFIRVDDDWRKYDGSSVLLEAWRSPYVDGGYIERVDINAFAPKNAEIKQVRVTYTINETHLEIGRTIDNNERGFFDLALPESYILSPESLIFGGLEVVELSLRSGEEFPVISYLPTFLNDTISFRPVVHQQSAHFLKNDTITVDGKALQARCFEQLSSANDEKLLLWIDDNDILLQYKSGDGRHSAILSQYSRRRERKS